MKLFGLNVRPFWWWRADTRGVEVMSALCFWYWGVILALPHDTFKEISGYRVMKSLPLTEENWAGLFCFVALIQSLAMCGNVQLFRYPGALLAFTLWLFLAIAFFLADSASSAPGLFMVFAASQAWVILRGPTNGQY